MLHCYLWRIRACTDTREVCTWRYTPGWHYSSDVQIMNQSYHFLVHILTRLFTGRGALSVFLIGTSACERGSSCQLKYLNIKKSKINPNRSRITVVLSDTFAFLVSEESLLAHATRGLAHSVAHLKISYLVFEKHRWRVELFFPFLLTGFFFSQVGSQVAHCFHSSNCTVQLLFPLFGGATHFPTPFSSTQIEPTGHKVAAHAFRVTGPERNTIEYCSIISLFKSQFSKVQIEINSFFM